MSISQRPAVKDFLANVIKVCRRHGFSISHEDGHGAFEIVPFDEGAAEWLACARDETEKKEEDE
jgi:hypothetical protein